MDTPTIIAQIMNEKEKSKDYYLKSPCSDCPYKKSAPLQKWSKEEFITLLQKENSFLGASYECHKKNGHRCVGWLMNQDKRNQPSFALRMDLAIKGVDRTYLDSLTCKSPMYSTVEDMCTTNYSDIDPSAFQRETYEEYQSKCVDKS